MSATETIEATDRTAFASIQEAVENAVEYVGAAGASAGASVKSAAGKSGELIGVGAYKGAYGVSYGVVFSAVFLKELLPVGNSLRRGFEDGADAAFTAVEARKSTADVEAAPKKTTTRKTAAKSVDA
ncbi:hypothetical protein [Methylopila sp. M107]|uniref:hypothetical protein n=1 Tax=Methylopila sp. M107 TaxID=1101190 RepID=UPI000378739D|nr:hypothetical protein [Methylopila sp. M107]